MKLFFTLLLLSFLWTPLDTFAASEIPSPISIDLETQTHNSIIPGDIFADTFLIKNQSKVPVRLRLAKVNNI